VHQSKSRIWALFAVWSIAAIVCGALDHVRRSSLFLSVFLVISVIVAVIAIPKNRPRNYKFDLVRPGVVRSPLGFEVRASNSRIEYAELDHVVSWQAAPLNASARRFDLSERGICGWESPFTNELMNSNKKREIAKATIAALMYLQLVDAGKVRPKAGRVANP